MLTRIKWCKHTEFIDFLKGDLERQRHSKLIRELNHTLSNNLWLDIGVYLYHTVRARLEDDSWGL